VFQSTRPRGARPMGLAIGLVTLEFQSTRPRGARRQALCMSHSVERFNPRARVGRDLNTLSERLVKHLVSIHAPAWGATRWSRSPARQRCGFNPRARVGRDGSMASSGAGGSLFQSTRPRGARRDLSAPEGRFEGVSIHAPAWGATRDRLRQFERICVSIHAPAWGATLIHACAVVLRSFQSTRPRGARRTSTPTLLHSTRFHSTRPRGARPCLSRHPASASLLVSIHAPAWGATRA